jgi:predicted DsbA family dithiol-disulfide isomerase
MVRKFGSAEAFDAFKKRHGLVERASEVGISWDEETLSRRVQSSTLRSHRLVQWVAHHYSLDTAEMLYASLNRRHFTEGGALNDLNLLLGAAEDVGVDTIDANTFLASSQGETEVLRAVDIVHQLGIHSIPTLIVDGQYMLNGATHYNEICDTLRSVSYPASGKQLFAECLKF